MKIGFILIGIGLILFMLARRILFEIKHQERVRATPRTVANNVFKSHADSLKIISEYRILPEGIVEDSNGNYLSVCCVCGELSEIYCDIEDVPDEGYEHYCGKSPICCP